MLKKSILLVPLYYYFFKNLSIIKIINEIISKAEEKANIRKNNILKIPKPPIISLSSRKEIKFSEMQRQKEMTKKSSDHKKNFFSLASLFYII